MAAKSLTFTLPSVQDVLGSGRAGSATPGGIDAAGASFADLVEQMGTFAQHVLPGAVEYAEEQRRIEERATWLRARRPIGVEDARRVALFSLGTWAQRYPVQSHDLDEDAALFLCDWLSARNVDPTEDNLHEALKEWRAHRIVDQLESIASQARDGAVEIRSVVPFFRDLGGRFTRGKRHALRPPTRGFWARRCRCAACRKRWQAGQE